MKGDALICGVQAYMESSYISISLETSQDDFENYMGQYQEFRTNDTPESLFIEKEGYELLSEEAKQIVNIILSSPNELLRSPLGKLFFSGKKGNPISGGKTFRTKLVAYLASQWEDKRYARKVVHEIEEYVKTF